MWTGQPLLVASGLYQCRGVMQQHHTGIAILPSYQVPSFTSPPRIVGYGCSPCRLFWSCTGRPTVLPSSRARRIRPWGTGMLTPASARRRSRYVLYTSETATEMRARYIVDSENRMLSVHHHVLLLLGHRCFVLPTWPSCGSSCCYVCR